MADLQIIDVPACVYTGCNTQNYRERQYYNYPIGGIHFLMRYLSTAIGEGDDFVLCFDSPNFRRELYPQYKSGRSHNPVVISQIETLYSGLSSCGIKCEKYDHFEADDIIDWAVSQNLPNYSDVIIIGNDYDLCHSVQSKVRFKTIRKDMNCIYRGNFENSIERGEHILFNTISAYKVFCGCTSDKIPSITLSNGFSGKRIYYAYVDFLKSLNVPLTYSLTSGFKPLLLFSKQSGLFNDAELEDLLRNITLVFPAECPPDVRILPNSSFGFSRDKLSYFLSMYNDYTSLSCIGGHKVYLTEEDKQALRDKSRALSSGEFAADRNLAHEPRLACKTLNLDAFEKEF